jgi:cysteine desulfurase
LSTDSVNTAIYLDYNASTPIHPAVQAAMAPFLAGSYGNPSSGHWAGAPAAQAVARARAQIADLLGCSPREVIFTSGGTESNNTSLLGAFWAADEGKRHIVTTRIEHPAIIEPCHFLERLGAEVTYVGVDSRGLVDPEDIAKAIRADTILVSVMHANNEVGTIQPIAEIARVTQDAGVLLHSDAAQSAGKLATKVDDLGVDLLSLAGHKFYGPKGIGALYIREGTSLEPFMHGAGHESGRRAGTENVLLDAGLGAAAELAADLTWTDGVRQQRDWLWAELQGRWGDRVVLNGHPTKRLPNTLNVSFIGMRGADILAALPEVAASTGSACHADSVTLSPVLDAMGVSLDVGAGAIRLSLGRMTTQADLEDLLRRLAEVAS